jgi:hypothetical protein
MDHPTPGRIALGAHSKRARSTVVCSAGRRALERSGLYTSLVARDVPLISEYSGSCPRRRDDVELDRDRPGVVIGVVDARQVRPAIVRVPSDGAPELP